MAPHTAPAARTAPAAHAAAPVASGRTCAAEVASEDIGGEAIGRVVGEANDFGLTREAEEGGERPKRFLPEDLHRGTRAAQHRRLVKVGAEGGGARAADEHGGALAARVVDLCCHLVDCSLVNQRSEHDALVKAVALAHAAHALGQPRGEGVVDACLHEDAVGADARLRQEPGSTAHEHTRNVTPNT